MQDHLALQSFLLADSDIWSELLSLVVVFLFFSVPAIIKALAEANKKKTMQAEQGGKQADQEKKYLSKIRNAKNERRQQFQSEWDRRQQMIRERLGRSKEKEQAIGGLQRPHLQPPPMKFPHEENLPVAVSIHEEPPIARPAPVPKPAVSAVQRAYETYQAAQYVQPPPKMPVQQPQAAPKKTRKPVPPRQQTAGTTHAVIERIIRTSNPLKAGIILKEIFDKPRALRIDSEYI